MMICIVVVDDHPIIRDGLRAILETQADFEVVGEAATGGEAVDQALRLRPDLLLLDLEMPGMDGVEAIRRIRAEWPEARIIVFTAYDSDDRVLSAVQAGAQGYVLKGAPREEVFQAIRVVNAGGSLLHPLIASRLLQKVAAPGAEATANVLTERELQVLQLMASGLPNKEIAEQLTVTERTVKFHVSSILGKLGVTNRTEAVSVAARQRLVKLR